MSNLNHIALNNLPNHIAIIMDGNGRWAKKKGFLRAFGHENGTKSVRTTVEACAKLGVKNLTLYAFSTENWNRPKLEVETLMKLLISSLKKELKTLVDNNIRLNSIGNLERLPKSAQKEYEAVRSESRQGFAISPEDLCRIDGIISPLVQQGQSVHHICANNADEIMLDEKTIYNYIDAGLLSVGNIDLPRKVRYRIRKKKKPVRVDKQCHLGRTYNDFLEYMAAHPDTAVVQMDSVEGKKGGKVLLTIFFQNCDFMLAFIRDHNTARSVTNVFNSLDTILGREAFCELFPVILTDRGSEFTDPLSIECDANGEVRARVFFCDPQRSDQKGGCEVTHEMIRRVLPKGVSFDHLTQRDINLMMSHINSYTRKKLNNRSAHQLFSILHGDKIFEKLDAKLIPANKINLTPNLIKQK